MNASLKIISLLFCVSWACKSAQKDEKGDNKNNLMINPDIYEDIDPFTLTGVNKIKESSVYPHIRIEEEDTKRRIVYKITRVDSAETSYEKKNGYWARSYDLASDTGSIKSYEYILPDKIVELKYYGTKGQTNFQLQDAAVMQANVVTTYIAGEKKFSFSPGINVIDSVKDKAAIVMTEKKDPQGSLLLTSVSHFDRKKNKITYTDTACFSGQNRSWFWFRHFMGQLIPCR